MKGWRGPLVGLAVGCALVVGLELGLRRHEGGPGPAVALHVPQLGAEPGQGRLALSPNTVGVEPYVGTDQGDGTTRWTTEPRLTATRPGVLQASDFVTPKPEGVVRVFVIGGSEVYGIPVEQTPQLTYPGQLQAQLQHSLPGVQVQVINSGVVGQESSQMLLMFQRVARLEPDAIVFTGGGNDYRWQLERAANMNQQLWGVARAEQGLATFRLLRRLVGQSAPAQTLAPPDDPVDAVNATARLYLQELWNQAGAPLISWPEGGEASRTDPDSQQLDAAYEGRLRTMTDLAAQGDFRLVLAPPPTNPFLEPQMASRDPRLGPRQQQAITDQIQAARAALDTDPAQAEALCRQALAREPTWATAWFVLAQALDRQGQVDPALDAFVTAGQLDLGYLRVPRGYQAAAARVCATTAALCVDPTARFLAETQPGDYTRSFFHSPTHMSEAGQALIAQAVAEILAPALEARQAAQP